MNLENKEFTFWNLISDYTIEIPAIQRDYVQDKLYSELQKEECDIVGDIANSLSSSVKTNLHFVYGKVDNTELIPLDGQQRLTTLFLIHWFLSLGTLSEENKKKLSKFTYETRPSSEDFCLKLVKESINYIPKINDDDDKRNISKQISDSKWFFLSWKSDPTIKAMLNMLDVIQAKFRNPNKEQFSLLCDESNCPVTFNFLPLEQFKLDDEIYVKMNSRGKPLSDFENFKANFSILFDDINKSKLDNEWLDIFWQFEKDNETINLKEVDNKYLNFFKNTTLNFIAETSDVSRKFKDAFNIFVQYKNVYFNNCTKLQQLSYILDGLISFDDNKKYFKNILADNPSYWERARFYALSCFFIKKKKIDDSNQDLFHKWMRVCTNLIDNTRIEDPELFYRSIRSIKELSEHIDDLYNYLSKPDAKIDFFSKEQGDEEKLKAKLILDDRADWSSIIERIENHSYFNGQIGFILNFSKYGNEYDINKFSDYSYKMSELFSSKFKDSYDCLFQRALLSYGDYLVPISGHYTFCNFEKNLRAKTDNWRKVFNEDSKNIYLKQLLDTLKIETIKDDLQLIVEDFKEDENDWRTLFIKNSAIVEYCINFQINKKNNNGIDLARSPATKWRKRAELRSYVFYKTKLEGKGSNFRPFLGTWYYDCTDDIPCAVIDSWHYQNKYSLALDIKYLNDKYSLIFYDRNWKALPDEIIQKLNQIGFNLNKTKNEENVEVIKSCVYTISTIENVEKIINQILKMD